MDHEPPTRHVKLARWLIGATIAFCVFLVIGGVATAAFNAAIDRAVDQRLGHSQPPVVAEENLPGEGTVGEEISPEADLAGAGESSGFLGTWGWGAASYTFRSDNTMTVRAATGSAEGTWRALTGQRIEVVFQTNGEGFQADWEVRDGGRFLHLGNRVRV